MMIKAQGPRSSRATIFCGSLLFLLLSFVLATIAIAADSAGSKTDVGRRVQADKIDFFGNEAFSSEKLQEVLSHADPRCFTKSGSLNPNALYLLPDYITAFYYDDGFLEVQVDQPQFVSATDRVMIGIDEGPLYRVGSISIEGQLKYPRREVESQLTMRSEQPFRGSTLQQNVLALADFYSDRGFAYVNVDPRTKMDHESHIVDVKFFIKPGDETRIDQITISGNTKTPEQVIRAALQIHEHDLYSARAFRESKARLDELGLFSGTHITTQPSDKSDEINVEVNVVEKSKV
jgi:outer membrane protein insertion porin family